MWLTSASKQTEAESRPKAYSFSRGLSAFVRLMTGSFQSLQYTHTCTCMYTYMYIQADTHANIRAHTHTHIRAHICTHSYPHTSIHIYTHARTHAQCLFPFILSFYLFFFLFLSSPLLSLPPYLQSSASRTGPLRSFRSPKIK